MTSGRGARSQRAALAIAALLVAGCFPRDPNPADTTLIDSVMAPAPDIVGHDSAFGPIGTIDSLGNIEPIRR